MPIDTAYWNERFKQLEQSEHREAVKVYSDIEDMYKAADRELEQKISTWYQRFATNNGVTMAEARRLLDSRELKELKWTLEDYIKHGKENGISADWSKQLENASARYHITRLQALQLDLQQTVEVLYGGQSDAFDRLMKQTYLDSYYRTAFEIQKGIGIGWDIAKVNGDQLQSLLQRPWTVDGRNFSDRIWSNKTALIGELQKTLQQNVILGYPPDHLIQEFSHKLGVSESNAARLLYTESAYFREISQGNSFRALGVDNVIFIATLDERTSDICQQMDGTVIPMKDYQPGVTVPPLHPWCRSTTAPYYKDLEGIGERAARDPDTGKTYWIPRSMKYPEWNASFVNGAGKTGLTPTTPGVTLTLAGCSSIGEVETWMKDHQWFKDGKVSLSGCDLESAKAIAEAYEQVFDEFPFLSGNIDGVSAISTGIGSWTYAQCYTRGGGRVEVNIKYYKDSAALKKSYLDCVKQGFHPQGTDWVSIVTHEIGHALDGYLSNLGLGGNYGIKDVSAMMRPKVMRTCGLKVADARTEVSEYATKNAREWFAECFAESMRSANPRKVATEFMKQLKEVVKGVNQP